MTTSIRSSSLRRTLPLAACALAAAAYFAAPAHGADSSTTAPTAPKSATKPAGPASSAPAATPALRRGDIKVIVVKADESFKPQGDATSSDKSGGKGGGHGATAGNKNMSTSSDVVYAVTVRNTTKAPVKGLTLEYHFYNETIANNNGVATTDLSDVSSTETLDLDPGKGKDFLTQPIPVAFSATYSGGGGGGGKKGSISTKADQSTTTTKLLGYHVEVRYNDKVMDSKDDPSDVKDRVDKINKQNSGGK